MRGRGVEEGVEEVGLLAEEGGFWLRHLMSVFSFQLLDTRMMVGSWD